MAIARALFGSPSLLLCDEPTGNLDSVNTESVLSLFHELEDDGLTLVVITHEEDVAAHARREVRMVDGHLTEVAAVISCRARLGGRASCPAPTARSRAAARAARWSCATSSRRRPPA